MNQELTQALQSAQATTQALQAELKTADAVTALVLLPMIADASRLAARINELLHAKMERG